MNPDDPNIALVEVVVQRLGPLCDRFVFVGGCATGLLVTDSARPPVRATRDVDLITEVATIGGYYELHRELKELGFNEDGELTCRWRVNDVIVDVMPTNEKLLGFGNRWYPRAVEQAEQYTLPSGNRIHLVSSPLFVATKIEAFHGRGGGNYGTSHDIEDLVTVVDGRSQLPAEVADADADVREYLIDEIEAFLTDPNFVDTLNWHFSGDAANQARVPELIRSLREIARF